MLGWHRIFELYSVVTQGCVYVLCTGLYRTHDEDGGELSDRIGRGRPVADLNFQSIVVGRVPTDGVQAVIIDKPIKAGSSVELSGLWTRWMEG